MSDNSTENNESQKIYASMSYMSSNTESPRIYLGDSSQLTNWMLDSGATCHMTPDISDFITVSMMEIDKYIEVADGNFHSKTNRIVSNRMRKDNGKTFIDTLYNVLFSLDL